MNMIRLLISSTIFPAVVALSGMILTATVRAQAVETAAYQELAREAIELAKNQDAKNKQAPASKVRLKDGSNCTLKIGSDRQARCAETGKAFNALIVQCGTMPQQLRARCEAAQSNSTPKGR
ncbi:MAG: hypothetical protein ABL931_07060 [Usitatibacteraceae bacterium]